MAFNATLTQIVTDTTTISAPLFTIIGQAVDLIATHPLLMGFVGLGIVSIGIRKGIKTLKAAKHLAN